MMQRLNQRGGGGRFALPPNPRFAHAKALVYGHAAPVAAGTYVPTAGHRTTGTSDKSRRSLTEGAFQIKAAPHAE